MSAANVIVGPPVPPPVDTKLGPVLSGMALAIAAGDAAFWGQRVPGFSTGVFFAVLAAAVLFNRRADCLRTTASLVILALLTGSLVEAAIETGFTNGVMLLALTGGLAGSTFFTEVTSLGGRLLSQLIALIRGPGRVIWLIFAIIERCMASDLSGILRLLGLIVLLVPSLLLVLGFGALLANGNAVFGTWTHDGFAWLWNQLTFDLDPWRIVMWVAMAIAVLPLLRPVRVAAWWWSWTERLPRWPDLIPHRAAILNSALVLAALNVLFAVANVADALFLWSGRKLPAGVTYSGFVHSGVNTLVVTVLLSALVLTSLFQQTLAVARRRSLKMLGGAWIAQNLFLLASVSLRLKCYTEAYDLTVERLGVVIFLVLVAAGYGLLAVKIVRDKSLSWLAGGGVLAFFAVLYITQFLNLAGWAADYNEARWERDKSRALDVAYLHDLGPAAWPALVRAKKSGAIRAWDISQANEDGPIGPAVEDAKIPRTRFDGKHWRAFSLRAWWNRSALPAEAK
jgi:hypothetical protein